jgi:hypothetical protein
MEYSISDGSHSTGQERESSPWQTLGQTFDKVIIFKRCICESWKILGGAQWMAIGHELG